MQVIDLFAGIGGFSVAADSVGWETKVFCEIEKFPQAVLKKNFPGVPVHGDIRTLTYQKLIEYGWSPDKPTVLTGGFPCQPFSVAGKRQGTEDDRFLWPEMLRVAEEAKPAWIVGENVGGFVSMDIETGYAEVADQEGAFVLFKKVAQQVIDDLKAIGYDVPRTDAGDPIFFVIPACAIDAPHRRDRVWIVAHRNDYGLFASKIGQRFYEGDDGNKARTYEAKQFEGCAVSGGILTKDSYGVGDGGTQKQGDFGKFGDTCPRGNERDFVAANGANVSDAYGAGLQEPRQTNKREFQKENREGLDDRLEQLCCGNASYTEGRWIGKGKNGDCKKGGSSCNESQPTGCGADAANASGSRFEKLLFTAQPKEPRQHTRLGNSQFDYWRNFPTEPPLHLGDDGLRAELVRLGCRNPDKVIRDQRKLAIKGAGNAIVPWIAYEIFKVIDFVEREINLSNGNRS